MSNNITGGCACGAIKYSTAAEPQFTVICQCRQCQHISGSGHAAQFAVPTEETKIEGKTSTYELTAESGSTVNSCFCGKCGSPIYKTTTKMPELMFFHAATMNDPSTFKPQMVVYESSKQPWDHVDPSLPRN